MDAQAMRAWLLVLICLPAVSVWARERRSSKRPTSTLWVNDEAVQVRWTDGDSFKFLSGAYEGHGTRLMGFNTLEAFGPVHRWGTWTPTELFTLAKSSAAIGASREWACTTDGKKDGYGRVLVACPALAEELIRQGHALAYSVDGVSEEKLLAAQREAIEAGRGMWAGGAPKGIVTSVHSIGEEGDETPYNRVVDTRTGAALKRPHQQRYEICQEICEDTEGDVSCMVWVPFQRRYRNKPDCLR
jgi:micrococcal nuclease